MLNKKDIISNVDKSWPKDLIIRHLYVGLAPCYERDYLFFTVPSAVQIKMFKNGELGDPNKHICTTLCQEYQTIFQNFGIESIIVPTNNEPVTQHGLIVFGDYVTYFIDPLKDLQLNQYGCETTNYGIIPLSKSQDNKSLYPGLTVLDPNYLREMDSYLGFLKCGMYTSDFISSLRNEIFSGKYNTYLLSLIGETKDYGNIDTLIEAKIALMNNELINIGNVPGIIERQLIYKYLIRELFSPEEQELIKTRLGFRKELLLLHNMAMYEETKEQNGQYILERKR